MRLLQRWKSEEASYPDRGRGHPVGDGRISWARRRTDRYSCRDNAYGKGAVSDTMDVHLGMVGMHGSYAANMAVTECDLLIAIGARFDDRVTGDVENFAPNAKSYTLI